ncbi:MAG: hypothetical protein ACRDTE_17805 [Pseudonocardiaceae bacterium]
MINPLPLAEMVPLSERSLGFGAGMFQDMTFTRMPEQCRSDAQRSRAVAATSAHPLLCIARAAWWEAVAARIDAEHAARA